MTILSKFINADQFRSFISDVSHHALTVGGMLKQPGFNDARINLINCFAVYPGAP